jgi:hypothetical protein
MNNSPHCALSTDYKANLAEETVNTFLVLEIDNPLNWKRHINQLIPKWSMLCTYVSVAHKPY